MLAYRTDEDAARLVAEQLERETAELWRENVALATKLARSEAARDAALERLADAGPGGGRASARRDRVGLGALLLAAVAVALLPLHVSLLCEHRALAAAIAPVQLLLAAPGALAVWVAYRYRRVSLGSRLAYAVGAGVAVSSLLEIALGVGR